MTTYKSEPAATHEVLSFRNLTYSRNGRQIFDNLNLSLKSGEIHALMSGRSYDMNNLTDLISGNFDLKTQVVINGKELDYGQLKNYSCTVTHRAGLFPEFSIANNLFIHYSSFGAYKKTVALLNELGIEIDPKARVQDLSSSEKKILEIARGYASGRPILVLYESLFHIDNNLQRTAVSVIKKIAGHGVGIIYLTSKLEDALLISDRISVVENGMIIGSYPTVQVRSSPKHLMELMAGLDTELADDMDTIEVLNAIVSARELIYSAMELQQKIHQYAKKTATLLGGDFCSILLKDVQGERLTISYPEKETLPSVLLDAMLDDHLKEKVTIQNAESAFSEPIPYSTLIYAPIKEEETMGIIGGILVGYQRQFQVTRKTDLLLSTIVNDVLITFESSKVKTKSMLLQESNHRIKNNLQMIISLLYVQKQVMMKHPPTVQGTNDFIDATVSRIRSISLVHEIITAGGERSESIVSLNTIIDGIEKFYQVFGVELVIHSDSIMLSYDKATFIALAVNELISNSIKHAFPERSAQDQIRIDCLSTGDMVEIIVSDNGIGISDEKLKNLSKESNGLQIVNFAMASVGGTISYQNEHGTTATMKIPKKNLFSSNKSAG